MTTWITNRDQKSRARELALSCCGPKQSALMLPGSELACIQTASSLGLFVPGTKCFMVEKIRNIYELIEHNSKSLDLNTELYFGKLENFVPAQKLDFAFIDLNGPLTRELAWWFANVLSDNISDNFDLSITLAYAFRNNRFAHECLQFFKTTGSAFTFEESIRSYLPNEVAVSWICAISLAMGMTFRIREKSKYRDTVPMLMLSMTDFKKDDSLSVLRNDFLGLVGNYCIRSVDMRTNDRRKSSLTAGKKAWITRKKNEVSERQRQAAYKAWKTRRAKAG